MARNASLEEEFWEAKERRDPDGLDRCREPLQSLILSALVDGDGNSAARYAWLLGECTVNSDSYPEHALQFLLKLILRREFLESEAAYLVLHDLETEWDRFSDTQRSAFLPVLEEAYPLFQHWRSCFISAEIIGERIGTREALDLLRRLTVKAQGQARRLLPYAFRLLAEHSPARELVQEAVAELLLLRSDPSEAVRAEAEESLRLLDAKNL